MEIIEREYTICPRCLDIHPMGLGSWCGACQCDHLLKFHCQVDKDDPFWKDEYQELTHQKAEALRNNPEFSEKAYNKRIKNSAESYNRRAQREYSNAPQSSPKCPTCGSSDVAPISTAQRVTSGLLLGIFSGDIGKSYQCNSCKYKW